MRLWTQSTAFGMGLSILTAAIYFMLQWSRVGQVQDVLFACLLLLNAGVVAFIGLSLGPRVKDLFSLPTMSQPDAFQNIFGSRQHLFVAATLSMIAPGGVYIFDTLPWSDPVLNAALCTLLFAANWNIGFGLVTLAKFWRYSAKAINQLELRILNATRPDLSALLDIVSITVLLVGVICSAALLSILCSQFTLSIAVVAFSVFSLGTVICSYAIPLLPLVRKLRVLKTQELHRVESEIDAMYLARSNDKADTIALDLLLAFRREIRAVHVFPPNGQFSFSTAASVTFLSFLPTVLDYLIKASGS
jgi:hypothetical protein